MAAEVLCGVAPAGGVGGRVELAAAAEGCEEQEGGGSQESRGYASATGGSNAGGYWQVALLAQVAAFPSFAGSYMPFVQT